MQSRVVVLLSMLCACGGGGELGRGAQTTLTSGEAHPSKPPESRTVDNTGFVDNSGRTSEETTRPETAGVRVTETGTDRTTGTNTGVPNGARTGAQPEAPLVPKTAALAPRGNVSPIAGYGDEPGKLGRAMCDHEKACDRVGAGRTWESDDACTSTLRARAIADLDKASCSLDASAVSVCLGAIRKAPCDRVIDRPSAVDLCVDAAICSR